MSDDLRKAVEGLRDEIDTIKPMELTDALGYVVRRLTAILDAHSDQGERDEARADDAELDRQLQQLRGVLRQIEEYALHPSLGDSRPGHLTWAAFASIADQARIALDNTEGSGMSDLRREVERLRDWLLCDARKSYPRSDLFSAHIADRLTTILDARSDQGERFNPTRLVRGTCNCGWQGDPIPVTRLDVYDYSCPNCEKDINRFVPAPSDQEGERVPENFPAGYLPMACPNCGRVRLEYGLNEDGKVVYVCCEKCGEDDFSPSDQEGERCGGSGVIVPIEFHIEGEVQSTRRCPGCPDCSGCQGEEK